MYAYEVANMVIGKGSVATKAFSMSCMVAYSCPHIDEEMCAEKPPALVREEDNATGKISDGIS